MAETLWVGTPADTAINSTTDVTIVTRDVTSVAAGNTIIVDAWFTCLANGIGTGVGWTFTLDFDGLFDIELGTPGASMADSATARHPFHIYAVCDVRSTSLAYAVVFLDMQATAGLASGADTTAAATPIQTKGWGTSASDATGTTTVALKARSDNVAATQTLRLHQFTIRKQATNGATTATPGTASLTTATFVPVVTASDHKTAVPGTASLTMSAFAPTIVVGVSAVPGTASLTTATFAPVVTVSDHKTVVPGTAALVTSRFAPVIALTVIPSTAALATSSFAPTVSVSNNQSVVPGTASLSLSTFAPTVAVSNNQAVVPGTAALSTSTFAPTVSISANQTAVPGTAALTTATFAPTVSTSANQAVVPGTASLTLATFAPTVTAGGNQAVVPGTASLTLLPFAPTVTATGAVVAPATSPPHGAALVTGPARNYVVAKPVTATPNPGRLRLLTHAPAVEVTNYDEQMVLLMLLEVA